MWAIPRKVANQEKIILNIGKNGMVSLELEPQELSVCNYVRVFSPRFLVEERGGVNPPFLEDTKK